VAGIGLTLRKLVADQTYLHGAAAYLSSGIISAGPWLISVVSLSLLQGAVASFLKAGDRQLFIASLIITGPVQFVLTRVIADHIFLDEFGAISPSFTRIIIQTLVAILLIVIPFLLLAPFDFSYRLLAASLFISISLLWLGLTAVSAAQDYVSLVLAFLTGYAVSAGAVIGLGRLFGLLGALEGFTLGQIVCLSLLIKRIYLEFPAEKQKAETDSENPWREYWALVLIGLFYYLGLWAEKLFYWFSPAGTSVHGFFRVFPPYDSSMLLAYLLTIPASSVILINLETEFYGHYHAYYAHILKKGKLVSRGTLKQIQEARQGMIEVSRSGFLTLLKVQGMIAVFAILIAPDLANLIGLPADYLTTLRVAILAASGQVFVLYILLLLLYLDARYQTLFLAIIFTGSNFGLTFLFTRIAPDVYGLGYLLSTLITALMGRIQLNLRLLKLDYITFMLQPFESPKKSRKVTD
jgi:uncharacterized membrane protein